MQSGAALRIKLANSSNSQASKELIVDRNTITFWSSCADGLPEDAAEWDLSQLLIEGKTVERSTVVAWLNLMYQLTHSTDFQQQEDNPAVRMSGLAQLLAFADAVGSSRGLINACFSNLDSLRCDIKLENGNVMLLDLESTQYMILYRIEDTRLQGPVLYVDGPKNSSPFADLGSRAGVKDCKLQLSTSTESLLYLSNKLQLPALRAKLQAFIKKNNGDYGGLCPKVMSRVVSDRVLDAFPDPRKIFRRMVIKRLAA